MIYFLLLNHRLLKTISCLPLIPLALIPILKVLLFGKVGLKKKSIFKQTNLLSLLAEENKGTNWKIIASSFKNKTAIECSNHYKQNLAVRRHWSAWTPEEDKILTEWVSLNGPTKWEACSRQLTSRSGKQCRNRWINSISLIEKKPEWSPEDEYKLFFLFDKMGGCWSRITNFFNGYSQNSIKNRFYNKIRKNTQDKQISESNSSSLNFSRKAVFHDDPERRVEGEDRVPADALEVEHHAGRLGGAAAHLSPA